MASPFFAMAELSSGPSDPPGRLSRRRRSSRIETGAAWMWVSEVWVGLGGVAPRSRRRGSSRIETGAAWMWVPEVWAWHPKRGAECQLTKSGARVAS
jgi:hypothetical protein